ncbi:glycosyltransferase [bacterium]|nr:glycosyltransferase [bacterium]
MTETIWRESNISHICHITTNHPPFDTRIFYRECLSLRASGYQVSLVAPHSRRQRVNGVSVIPLPVSKSVVYRRLFMTRTAARIASRERADLYHFHDPELIPAMQWLARRTRRPVVWDAHENYADTIPHFNVLGTPLLSRAGGICFDKLEIAACRSDFSGVVTITPEMAKRYRSRGIRTCELGNYSDIRLIPFPPTVKRCSRPRFISIGGHFKDREVMQIADAFCALRRRMSCEIAFWGFFQPADFEDTMRSFFSARGIAENDVTIGGPYPWMSLVRDLIPTGWVGCCLINPRDRCGIQAIPNRLFEYWSLGVPAVVSAGTEAARFVRETGGGMVIEENSSRAIAEAFKKFALHPMLVERMGKAGRKAVEKKYNWQSSFPALLNLYADLGVFP